MCLLVNESVVRLCTNLFGVFFFKQKTAYEVRISDWSSDVCSSDLIVFLGRNDHLPQGDKVGDGGLAAFAEGLQNGAKFLRRIALHDPLGDAIDEYGGNALAYALDRKSTRLNSSH